MPSRFLELSWADATHMTLGDYACAVTAIDTRGHTVVLKSDLQLTAVTPTINDVVGLRLLLDVKLITVCPGVLDHRVAVLKHLKLF